MSGLMIWLYRSFHCAPPYGRQFLGVMVKGVYYNGTVYNNFFVLTFWR